MSSLWKWAVWVMEWAVGYMVGDPWYHTFISWDRGYLTINSPVLIPSPGLLTIEIFSTHLIWPRKMHCGGATLGCVTWGDVLIVDCWWSPVQQMIQRPINTGNHWPLVIDEDNQFQFAFSCQDDVMSTWHFSGLFLIIQTNECSYVMLGL